jgi:S-disulfanyl-L-cysteine oxidoreductase SoxD
MHDTTLTITNHWPYATTLFDDIRHSMPWTSPKSLTDDQVCALTTYILAQNKLIDENQVNQRTDSAVGAA